MIRYIFPLLAVFLCACDDESPAPRPPAEHLTAVAPVDRRQNRIDELEAQVAKASQEKNDILRLTALNELLGLREQKAESEAATLRIEKKQAAADLADAKEKAWLETQRARLYWFAGILGFLALAGGVVAFIQPEIAKWAVRFSLACAAMAAVAVFVTRLLPYLWWIGGSVAGLAIVGYLVWNRLSDKTRRQVVTVVDKHKDEIPNYKEKFSKFIDSDVDKFIDKTRTHLGLKSAGKA